MGHASHRAGPPSHSGRHRRSGSFRTCRSFRCRCSVSRHYRCYSRRSCPGRYRHAFSRYRPEWRGADSLQFLQHAQQLAAREGYAIVNIDSTVILERPKLKDFRTRHPAETRRILRLDVNVISVKFKTAESVGPVGEQVPAKPRRRSCWRWSGDRPQNYRSVAVAARTQIYPVSKFIRIYPWATWSGFLLRASLRLSYKVDWKLRFGALKLRFRSPKTVVSYGAA